MFDESFRTLFFANPARLSLKNSNFLVSRDGFDDVSVPLKEIAFVVLESPQITITSALLSALAKEKITLLTCDSSHLISGIFTPFLSHYRANDVIKQQVEVSTQQKAILWQKVVKAKITNQANLAGRFSQKTQNELLSVAKKVRLNDTNNCEATAASVYFRALFGDDFTREELCFENSALNYAYAVIRACVVRSVVSAGLLPNFGIWHDNVYNQFNLADDLMEPFRIYADSVVKDICNGENDIFLSTKEKQKLVEILDAKVSVSGKFYTLLTAVNLCVNSYKKAVISGICELELPHFV